MASPGKQEVSHLIDILSYCNGNQELAAEVQRRCLGQWDPDERNLDWILWEVLDERGSLADPALYAIEQNYQTRLRFHAWQIVRDTRDAEEVVDDVLLKLYRQSAAREDRNLRAYLYTATHHLAINRWRSNNRILERPENGAEEETARRPRPRDQRPLPDEELISTLREQAAYLSRMLPDLTFEEVEHVMLRTYLGFSSRRVRAYWRVIYKERVSRQAEQTRWFRVQQKLKKMREASENTHIEK